MSVCEEGLYDRQYMSFRRRAHHQKGRERGTKEDECFLRHLDRIFSRKYRTHIFKKGDIDFRWVGGFGRRRHCEDNWAWGCKEMSKKNHSTYGHLSLFCFSFYPFFLKYLKQQNATKPDKHRLTRQTTTTTLMSLPCSSSSLFGQIWGLLRSANRISCNNLLWLISLFPNSYRSASFFSNFRCWYF